MIKLRQGKLIDIDKQVVAWRYRKRRFNRLSKLILAKAVEWHNGDEVRVEQWFDTVIPELKNRTPTQMFTPHSIWQLAKWMKIKD